MRTHREDVSRFVLLALVIAVFVVSLLGTWLVLDTGFGRQVSAGDGQVSFTRQSGGVSPSVVSRNPVEGGVIVFAKRT